MDRNLVAHVQVPLGKTLCLPPVTKRLRGAVCANDVLEGFARLDVDCVDRIVVVARVRLIVKAHLDCLLVVRAYEQALLLEEIERSFFWCPECFIAVLDLEFPRFRVADGSDDEFKRLDLCDFRAQHFAKRTVHMFTVFVTADESITVCVTYGEFSGRLADRTHHGCIVFIETYRCYTRTQQGRAHD